MHAADATKNAPKKQPSAEEQVRAAINIFQRLPNVLQKHVESYNEIDYFQTSFQRIKKLHCETSIDRLGISPNGTVIVGRDTEAAHRQQGPYAINAWQRNGKPQILPTFYTDNMDNIVFDEVENTFKRTETKPAQSIWNARLITPGDRIMYSKLIAHNYSRALMASTGNFYMIRKLVNTDQDIIIHDTSDYKSPYRQIIEALSRLQRTQRKSS